jgi:hypothetical protein
MKQTRVEKPKQRRDRVGAQILPLDPRDPDIVRAKALSRAARKPTARASSLVLQRHLWRVGAISRAIAREPPGQGRSGRLRQPRFGQSRLE